jgi:hypothetical protein
VLCFVLCALVQFRLRNLNVRKIWRIIGKRYHLAGVVLIDMIVGHISSDSRSHFMESKVAVFVIRDAVMLSQVTAKLQLLYCGGSASSPEAFTTISRAFFESDIHRLRFTIFAIYKNVRQFST